MPSFMQMNTWKELAARTTTRHTPIAWDIPGIIYAFALCCAVNRFSATRSDELLLLLSPSVWRDRQRDSEKGKTKRMINLWFVRRRRYGCLAALSAGCWQTMDARCTHGIHGTHRCNANFVCGKAKKNNKYLMHIVCYCSRFTWNGPKQYRRKDKAYVSTPSNMITTRLKVAVGDVRAWELVNVHLTQNTEKTWEKM